METLKSILRPVWNSPAMFGIRGHIFDLREYLSGYALEKRRFKENTGYDLNLENPVTFSDYLVRKKIFDRDPILPILADKYKVRSHIQKVLGVEAEKYLIPLLWHGKDPKKIPYDKFEGEYIIKSNHNSGPHFIVAKGEKPDRIKIISELKKQLDIPYGILKHEWAYRKIIPRQIVVERLMRDSEGMIPKDYKFHMIHGECAFIQVDFDRFIDHSRTLYDKNWNYIDVTLKFKQGREEPKPSKLQEMLEIARKLADGFDYIRIDLYAFADKVYIGEMTHYPGSGMEKFTPIEFDFELGKLWNKK